jgi:hypothetical protein
MDTLTILTTATTVVAPILTYLGVRHQSKSELKRVKEIHELEISRVREQSTFELEKLKLEHENKIKEYESNKVVDSTYDAFTNIVNGDMTWFDNLENMMDKVDKFKKKHSNHPAFRK